jgi:hypothetical protein
MSQSQFGDPTGPVSRAEFEAAIQRQNDMAVRCMAMENVVRGLATWLAAALPEASAEKFLDSLTQLPDFNFDPRMSPGQVESLRQMVEGQQRNLVEMVRRQRAQGSAGGAQ